MREIGYASLFTGAGGLDRGLERAGFTPLFFCENDKSCRKVLAHHWPEVPVFEDVAEVTEDTLAAAGFGGGDASGSHGRIRLLAGGFP